jgi:hypothetical protein
MPLSCGESEHGMIRAKTVVKFATGLQKWSAAAHELETDHLVFVATLITTLVVGYPADVYGIVNWLASLFPVAGPCSSRQGH